jgi:hypothetical protein
MWLRPAALLLLSLSEVEGWFSAAAGTMEPVLLMFRVGGFDFTELSNFTFYLQQNDQKDALSCNSKIRFYFKQIHDIAPGNDSQETAIFHNRHLLQIAREHPGKRFGGIIGRQ